MVKNLQIKGGENISSSEYSNEQIMILVELKFDVAILHMQMWCDVNESIYLVFPYGEDI